ncbi:MAG: hypothetical protein IKD75_14170 [Prevotella sp.]|nr:hypothetical protein [Prevotella sp.]
MKKYLMTGMAAAIVCAAFTSCSRDLGTDQGTAVQQTVEETYEKAFVTHFGEPADTQTWGFGSATVAGTRGVVGQPSVSEIGWSFNATLAKMSDDLAAAISSGTDVSYFSDYTKYQSWWGSNWNDKYYQINASVVNSNLSDDYINQVKNIILNEIPEGGNNLTKATSTGYSITTTGGPVTLTPIYHNSNSGDKISYYYYPANTEPTVDQIKALKKYTIGNMADPETCNTDNYSFYRKTFSLVYEDEQGNVSHTFPAGIKINFIISNTWIYNGNLTIYSSGGVTTSDETPEVTPEEPETPVVTPDEDETPSSSALVPGDQIFKYAVPENKTYFCGEYAVGGPYDQYFVRMGNNNLQDWQSGIKNDAYNDFGTSQTSQALNGYTNYSPGNNTNGDLSKDGTTIYYIKYQYNNDDGKSRSDDEFMARVGIRINGDKSLYVVELDDKNDKSGTAVDGFDGKYYANTTSEIIEFRMKQGKTYAIYAAGSKLWFYGCEVLYENSKRSNTRPGTRSVSNIVTTEIPNNPEFYGDAKLNTAIHNSGLSQWNLPDSKGYNITDPETPHVAVFSIGEKNYIGFEDWKDYDFNDVIFEVTGTEGGTPIEPDEPIEEIDEIVVIAEDLTVNDARPDFDFNDVVFKVKWNKTKSTVTVTLLAAGGTLPLYIGGTKENDYTDGYEVHAKFAEVNPGKVITTGTMINTYAGRHEEYKTPTFNVTNFSGTTIGEVANSIKVAVKKYGEMIELKAPEGGVPTKIAVKSDFVDTVNHPELGWCDEREDIDDKYNVNGSPLFKSYVKGELDDDWYTKINPED